MLSLRNFIKENEELLEALITFDKQAYPKFGNVVIMAGGAGSGKGFIKDKLLGIEGFTFDVDELKKVAAKTPAIVKKVKDETGHDLEWLGKNMGYGNEKNVAKVHEIIGDYLKLDDKKKQTLFTSILTAAPDRKPNLIFDVTMKSMTQLQKYTLPIQDLGYDKRKIHIVWVVNDIEVAKAQNISRGQKEGGRSVPVEILVDTHRGASTTMNTIINMGQSLEKYMDGDIVFAFNKFKVDSDITKSSKGGEFIEKANYVYIKRAGKPVEPETLNAALRAKIASYVPPAVSWEI